MNGLVVEATGVRNFEQLGPLVVSASGVVISPVPPVVVPPYPLPVREATGEPVVVRGPRSVGAVRETRPYTSVPLIRRHRPVGVMRTLVAKNPRAGYDNPDAEQYDGKPVRRWFRPSP